MHHSASSALTQPLNGALFSEQVGPQQLIRPESQADEYRASYITHRTSGVAGNDHKKKASADFPSDSITRKPFATSSRSFSGSAALASSVANPSENRPGQPMMMTLDDYHSHLVYGASGDDTQLQSTTANPAGVLRTGLIDNLPITTFQSNPSPVAHKRHQETKYLPFLGLLSALGFMGVSYYLLTIVLLGDYYELQLSSQERHSGSNTMPIAVAIWVQSIIKDFDVRLLAFAIRLLRVSFGIYFALMMMACIQTSITHPGRVPPNWGFYLGDRSKRRRYCRICNIWKPDRTHHCSCCQECILNMDHHCRVLNSCIGLYNRKFFIQFVIYSEICLTIYFTTCCLYIWYFMSSLRASIIEQSNVTDASRKTADFVYLKYEWFKSDVVDINMVPTFIVNMTGLILALVALGVLINLTLFLRMHLWLLLNNLTTIDAFNSGTVQMRPYDVGTRRNIEQVFGKLSVLWWLPLNLVRSSYPPVDGVRWRHRYDIDVETP